MNYVLESISTVPACDALLAGAKKKLQDLQRRARNLGESLVAFRQRIDQVRQESAQVQSLLEVFTSAYESLSPGKDKANMNIRIKRLELQRALLEKKAITCNAGALLAKERQYNALNSQVATLEAYIAAVADRRAELVASTLRVVSHLVALRRPVISAGLVAPLLRLPEGKPGRRYDLAAFRQPVRTGAHHLNVA